MLVGAVQSSEARKSSHWNASESGLSIVEGKDGAKKRKKKKGWEQKGEHYQLGACQSSEMRLGMCVFHRHGWMDITDGRAGEFGRNVVVVTSVGRGSRRRRQV